MKIEKTFKIKLNKHQKKHIDSLRWFLNDNESWDKNGDKNYGNRQTGRTELTLLLLIEKAINTGKKIQIIDHTQADGSNVIKHIVKRLEKMLKDMGVRKYSIDYNKINNSYHLTADNRN